MTAKFVDLFFRRYNVAVIAGIIVAAVLLGILNNLRVDEEKRVHWFGGPVVAADEEEEDQP